MHFLGVQWDNQTHAPSLKYRESPNKGDVQLLTLEIGKPYSFSVTSQRYCVGSKGQCPHGATTRDHSQCYSCSREDSTHFLSLAGLTQEQVDKLKTIPHFNYINIFGNNLLKVGVVAKQRKYSRVLEQAATATLFFSEGDGYVVRQIERFVSHNLHIKQAYGWETKIKILGEAVNYNELQSKLMNVYESVKSSLSSEYMDTVQKTPEFYINEYKKNFDFSSIDELYFVDKISPNINVSGIYEGTYGKMIVLSSNGHTFLLSTDAMQGYTIDIVDSIVPNREVPYKTIALKEKQEQCGLF